MRARSIAAALIGGPITAHLLVGAALNTFDPTSWPLLVKVVTIGLAAILGLAVACILEGDFDARA